MNRIFSTDSPKAIKAEAYGYLNAIHYMAPAELGGVGNLCPHASAGCRALCLGHYSGQASMVADLESGDNATRKSRREKAQLFMRDRPRYLAAMVLELTRLVRQANALGKRLCVRLNGSTDIAWETVRFSANGKTIFDLFPAVQFVDYTKNPRRFDRPLPANYWLTFSRSETNAADAIGLLQRGFNVAVVFAGEAPKAWHGFETVDGDTHDLRHLDPRGFLASGAQYRSGFVVALSPKGRKAQKDTSGFVVR
jgi:hypothetical protein